MAVGTVQQLLTFYLFWLTLVADGGSCLRRNESEKNVSALPFDPEVNLTAIEVITGRGYPAETHQVITKDGYILELHRIPHGRNQPKSAGRKPVLLHHGLFSTSNAFLIGPSDRALAFRLADSGYDVWLANARGNTYSRKHISLDPSKGGYWKFSLDHIGKYDVPDSIDLILNVTGQERLSFVGHSLGAAAFFIAMITHQTYNEKIDVMMAMSPAVPLGGAVGPLKFTSPLVRVIEFFTRLLRTKAFIPNDHIIPKLQRRFCQKNVHQAGTCTNLLYWIVGANSHNTDLSYLPVIQTHFPAGTSFQVFAQFLMNRNAGETFIPYDYGKRSNMRHYGQETPPPYDLKKVTCPIYLFYGENDRLLSLRDVEWLASQLPNLKEAIRIKYRLYNHMDFIWSTNNNELLYDQLISLLPSP